jgi:carboxypeptidase C (cathepsin A)
MIWVDQPSGTGYSMGVEEDEIVTSEKAVADDMYLFLEAFLIKFPEYATSIYLVGESFGGHYVTAIAHKIVEMNKEVNSANGSKNILIPLKGIAIGNGMTDTLEQLKWYPQMAFNSSTAPSVINQSVFEHMVSQIPRIVQTVRACQQSDDLDQCTEAFELYSEVLMMPVITTGANVYDLRLQNPYDFTAMDDFFNDPQVIREIGAKKSWVGVNVTVWQHLAPVDFLHSFQALIPTILEQGIKVLIYAGDQDYICNWLGVQAWTNNMEWEGRESFNLAKTQRWEGGTMKYFKKFAFVTVADSGHMVPMDQPKNSLKLFEALLAGGDFDGSQFK